MGSSKRRTDFTLPEEEIKSVQEPSLAFDGQESSTEVVKVVTANDGAQEEETKENE
jgi:hypothetical protein